MFVDEVKIKVIAGDGGAGCTSFRREKYVAMGGPDGGNGGKGSDIYFVGDASLKTLIDLRYKKIIKAPKGRNGEGSNRYGASADDIIIKVPLGTIIYDDDTGLIVDDITKEGQKALVAKGGRGGRGNKSFATHENPAPHFSEKGEQGEVRFLRCELKVLADVGIIGMPSVGKSTLLSIITSAKPRIASYHFTTLSPNLGVVKSEGESFVLADLPGLIEGASKGSGLGDKFLRHAYRCKILLHMVDVASEEGRNPVEDYKIIRKELEEYSSSLAKKKEIIVASKSDLPSFEENLKVFKKQLPGKEIIAISSYSGDGINELIKTVANTLKECEEVLPEEEFEQNVYIKFKSEKPYTITRENDVWVVKGEKIEKAFNMTKFEEEEGAMRFARILRAMGVEEELETLGAKPGDDVSINDFLFTFKG